MEEEEDDFTCEVDEAFIDAGDDSSEDGEDEEEDEGDTTAEQARMGKDLQGIPWEQIRVTRESYRETRLQRYTNYTNLEVSYEDLDKQSQKVEKGARYYNFQLNTRSVRCTVIHFQLRNLVWATSKHDVYVMNNSTVNHWSPVHRTATEVLNLRTSRTMRVQISTMAVHKNLLLVGGFNGELVAKRLDSPEERLAFSSRIAEDENAITNAAEIFEEPGGTTRVITSNNDGCVRTFDANSFACTSRFSFPWAVNYASVSPNSKMLCVVGDSPEGLLADSSTGKTIASLHGHLDFSFAAAWHPSGQMFATGNQDATTRIWDVRYLREALTVLRGKMGAIRSLRFSSDGRFLAMAEPVDFVHIFDLNQKCTRCQEIDLFGEVAGISFSPCSEAFFIGTEDMTYGSLLEFNRHHPGRYPNRLI